MSYQFKGWPELGWLVLVSVAVAVLQPLVTLEPDKITNLQTWLVALGAGAVRAGAGAALGYLTRPRSEPR